MPRRFDPTYNLDDRRDQDHWDAERDRISREAGGTHYEPVRHDTSYVSDEPVDDDSDDDLIRELHINDAMDEFSSYPREKLQQLEVELDAQCNSDALRSDPDSSLYDERLAQWFAVRRLLRGSGKF